MSRTVKGSKPPGWELWGRWGEPYKRQQRRRAKEYCKGSKRKQVLNIAGDYLE